MICTCGCNRKFQRAQMHDLRVMRPVSRECHKRRLARPVSTMSGRVTDLPYAVKSMLRGER
jgi:hypothetical protein